MCLLPYRYTNLHRVGEPWSASANQRLDIPPPDYDSSIFGEDLRIPGDAPLSPQQPRTANFMSPQHRSTSSVQYRSQFSAPAELNRTPLLPGDRIFVTNPLFEGQTRERTLLSVEFASGRNRSHQMQLGYSNQIGFHPIHAGQSVDRSMSAEFGTTNGNQRFGLGPSTSTNHQYRDRDRYPPSYNDALDMEKYELKRMFDTDRYPPFK